jgi:anti-anti-sigma factor
VTTPPADIERDERLRAVLVRLHGDIDSSNAADVMTPLADEALGQTLIIDLSDVQYIDSAGMAAIDTLRGATELYMIAPRSSIVRRALQIVGFDQLVPVFDRLEDINR